MYFDLQINGALGLSFTSEEFKPVDALSIAVELARHDVTQFAPTVITSSIETMCHSFRTLIRAIDEEPILDWAMPVFHLEGPWISPDDGPRGAHPLQHVREPSWEEFQRLQDAAGGRIKLVTLAPERPGALSLIEKLTAAGIVVALGHTSAKPEFIRAAASAGAKLSTHLGNGCAATMDRHQNVLWEQLADDRLMASIIVDGHHLPAALVKTIVRAKGVDNVILISDASPLAGVEPGRYSQWGAEIEVAADGRVSVAGTPYLAGSGAFLTECVHRVEAWAEITEEQAVAMATANPRRLLGL